MDILTGMILDYIVEKGLVTLTIVNELGSRKSRTFRHGKYSQKDIASFKNQNVIIEFETDNKEYPKLLRIQYTLRGISKSDEKPDETISKETG